MTKAKKKSDKKRKPLPKSIEAYMPLVHSIASMVTGKGLPPNIEYDDLVSDGTVGLMKAWDNFDPERGVKFETYASYRVRGEMLDGLKNYNPVPYRVQVMVRNLAQKDVSAVIKGEEKEEEKLIEKKELTESEFKQAIKKIKKIVSASALMYLLSIEQMAGFGMEAPVPGETTPAAELEFKELKNKIRNIVQGLPPLQKKIVELFYHKGLHQKTIAKDLKLSRPKVCRVLAKAIKTIQKKLKHA